MDGGFRQSHSCRHGHQNKFNRTGITNGFDSLKVIGIRFTANQSQGKTELEGLLTNHFTARMDLAY